MAKSVSLELLVSTENDPWTKEEINQVMSGELNFVTKL